jgi:hypothetical protein
MRGNLPQAFVHALHIEASIRLSDDDNSKEENPWNR